MKYKKYIVFGFYDYYPSGGLGDIMASFDSLEDAKDHIKNATHFDNNEIVDRDTWEVIE